METPFTELSKPGIFFMYFSVCERHGGIRREFPSSLSSSFSEEVADIEADVEIHLCTHLYVNPLL